MQWDPDPVDMVAIVVAAEAVVAVEAAVATMMPNGEVVTTVEKIGVSIVVFAEIVRKNEQ